MNFQLVKYELSCGLASQLPESTLPEIVFAGRSNVGKSSLFADFHGTKDMLPFWHTTQDMLSFRHDGAPFSYTFPTFPTNIAPVHYSPYAQNVNSFCAIKQAEIHYLRLL